MRFFISNRLKCNERILHDEELRTLRKQVQISEDYRIIIAKRDAEIRVNKYSFVFVIFYDFISETS